jgi:hypothetical protein
MPRAAAVAKLPEWMTAAPRCQSCIFWVPSPTVELTPSNERAGSCHRYAPHPGDTVFKRWPTVFSNDWCGEHAAKAPPDAFKPKPAATEVKP